MTGLGGCSISQQHRGGAANPPFLCPSHPFVLPSFCLYIKREDGAGGPSARCSAGKWRRNWWGVETRMWWRMAEYRRRGQGVGTWWRRFWVTTVCGILQIYWYFSHTSFKQVMCIWIITCDSRVYCCPWWMNVFYVDSDCNSILVFNLLFFFSFFFGILCDFGFIAIGRGKLGCHIHIQPVLMQGLVKFLCPQIIYRASQPNKFAAFLYILMQRGMFFKHHKQTW